MGESEPIAIIGMSCRLPQASSLETLWELLCDGKSAISVVGTESRASEADDRDASATGLSHAALLDEIDHFDPAFFSVSPREALAMDPQQRLMLELSWTALEQAGVVPGSLAGTSTGVFVGVMRDEYGAVLDEHTSSEVRRHAMPGTSRSVIANRVSYFLGAHGPSLSVDAAQASSLVAVHLACQSLRSGESSVALAGGVNLLVGSQGNAESIAFGGLSPDGRCYTFDQRANGYVRGEGGAVVVLKRLPDALADGDTVHGVILGSAVNNDGATTGLTVPSAQAQAEVIESALQDAGIGAGDVQYVELHGTGTPVGDPIEAEGLGMVYRGAGSLKVGSIKTNIGHLEAAAGIAGLLKVVLSLTHEKLPPSLNFSASSPLMGLSELGLEVQTELSDWPDPSRPRLAGVSSFGMGGTNCHLILGEVSRPQFTQEDSPATSGITLNVTPVPVSAKDAAGLATMAALLRDRMDVDTTFSEIDLAWSLATTRTSFPHRAVIVGGSRTDVRDALHAIASAEAAPNVVQGRAGEFGKLAFVFSGQGSQWVGMAADLLVSSPVFRTELEACADALAPHIDWSLLDVLRGIEGAPSLERVDVVQPALFAVMVALARLWQSLGVQPEAVVGHSQGEIAAAHFAGALTLADAAAVVALRSRLIAAISGTGGMASIRLSEARTLELLREYDGLLTVAGVNGPAETVVAGTGAAIESIVRRCEDEGTRARRVPVDYASHSPQIAPVREKLLEALARIQPRRPDLAFYSTVTGGLLDATALDAEYWFANLRGQVRFMDAIKALDADGYDTFVETSPHPVLAMSIQETLESTAIVVGSLRRGEGDWARMLTSAAALSVRGVPVDWAGLLSAAAPARIALPPYPFQRKRFWPTSARSVLMPEHNASHTPVSAGPSNDADDVPDLMALVRTNVAAVLGHASSTSVDPECTFKELGFDSVTAVDLRNRLVQATGMRLPAGLLFDYPTPVGLVRYLSGAERESARSGPRVMTESDDPIVIVGMACRYPGEANTPEQLWDLLASETDAISPFPANRGWNLDSLYNPDPHKHGTTYVRHGGFLSDVDRFDFEFFGISAREAQAMDPQQRLLLEAGWEAMERAHIDPATLRGSRTGVYVGAMATDYGPRLHQAPEGFEGYVLTGSSGSVASGRLSYVFGFEGPAITIDTACSSSLVALHMAVRALRSDECDMALVGGVTVMATPGMFLEFGKQRGLAPDGRCKPFAAGADGTAWAEGAGMLLVERLSDAQRNGHPVLAVVRGSAVNQDGASNGLTAPNGPSQQRVIMQALADARLSPSAVDAVEAHGTGTSLGDPIEVESLVATYGADRTRPLWLGSLKSNIGHAQAAAGIGGIIKMVMALRNGLLPKTLHVDVPSRHVDWDGSAISLLTEAQPWPARGESRRAAVSSFGISGTNAHVIIEEPPATAPFDSTADLGPFPLLVSGKSDNAVRAQAVQLSRQLADDADLSAIDVAFTLAHRSHLEYGAAVVGSTREELIAGLDELASGSAKITRRAGVGKIAFLFTGQGSQYPGMGRDLYRRYPEFAAALDEVCSYFDTHLDHSLREVMFAEPGSGSAQLIDDTGYAQPALFAFGTALYRLLDSWGVAPDYLAGHSLGEITAAHIAGVLSLRDAVALVAVRARLMQSARSGGAMVSIAGTEAEVRESLSGLTNRVDIAGVNTATSVVISGDEQAVLDIAAQWAAQGRKTKRLRVSHAFHSPHMDAVTAEFERAIADLTFHPPLLPVLSNVTGMRASAEQLSSPSYWAAHIREAVRFHDMVGNLVAEGVTTYLELGPDATLAALTAAGVPENASAVIAAAVRQGRPGPACLVAALAEIHRAGIGIHWAAVLAGGNYAVLPTYPFQRQRCWIPSSSAAGELSSTGLDRADHPLLVAEVELPDGGLLLTGQLSLSSFPWLTDHVIFGSVVVPATVFAEIALRGTGRGPLGRVAELTLWSPLLLTPADPVRLQVAVGPIADGGRRSVTIRSRSEGDFQSQWVTHASGSLIGATIESDDALGRRRIEIPSAATPVTVAGCYEQLAERGYQYGPEFQGLQALWRHGDNIYAQIELPHAETAEFGRYAIHPALLDAALHALLIGSDEFGRDRTEPDGLLLPFSWTGIEVVSPGATSLLVRLVPAGSHAVSVDIADAQGTPVASIASLVFRPATAKDVVGQSNSRLGSQGEEADLYHVDWQPISSSPAAQPIGSWAVLGSDPALLAVLGAEAQVVGSRDLAALAQAFTSGGTRPDAAVVCFDNPDGDPVTVTHEVAQHALALVQEWLRNDRVADFPLVLVTRRGVVTCPDDRVVAPTFAAVWGLVRAVSAEAPGRFRLIDIDGTEPSYEVFAAAVASGEPELAIRSGNIVIPGLVPVDGGSSLPASLRDANWRVDIRNTGTLANVTIVDNERATMPLAPREVRIAVRAAGVNFRDVALALGMVPEHSMMGLEAAGVVVEVGSDVTRFVVGAKVMGLCPAAFGPLAVADERLFAAIPDGWTFAQAASVPVVFLTAYYGLERLAGLRRGESLLVHAATGGVGMAAVQLARHWGAEVFGTASIGKWDVLRAQGFPEERIASSRDASFEGKFLAATAGRGVDVVLDCLANELVDASLRVLPRGGRFIEMGKTDIRDPERIAEQYNGVEYRAFDLLSLDYGSIERMFDELGELFDSGVLTPLPLTTWDMREAPRSLRQLGEARHIGKIVLTLPAPLDPNGTVLITGGTNSALAIETARHLVTRYGVKHLLLAGRRGPDAASSEVAEQFSVLGAELTVVACDVADRDALSATLAGIPRDQPLTAVIHAAGVLDDGLVEGQDSARLRRVMRPKVDGAWHLHELTRDRDLAAFVLFSSVVGTLGNAGQSTYAAANGFLDGLAEHRRGAGLAASSLAWGLWADAGMAATLGNSDLVRMARAGILPMSADTGLRALDAALDSGLGVLVPARLDPAATATKSPLWRALQQRAGIRATAIPETLPSVPRPSKAPNSELSPDQHREQVMNAVRAEVAAVLHSPVAAILADRPFKEAGFDSLTGVELRNRLSSALGVLLPPTAIFDHPTPEALAEFIFAELAGVETKDAEPAPNPNEFRGEEPIAITAMACRFPGGVATPQDLWDLVSNGIDAVGDFPENRGWDIANLYDPDPEASGKTYARQGGFIYDADEFDAEFFGISPREALAVEPQQRMMLEIAWEAIEALGVDPTTLRGSRTGVFVGAFAQEYASLSHTGSDDVDGYLLTGTTSSVISGRVAYELGLEGPALTIDTACSSSLVALHTAVQSLRNGDCDLALAGGVTVMSTPGIFVDFSRQRGLASDGRCKSFSDNADGTIFGEGAGLLVVERLSDARRNGHPVLAVIRGSAMNQDGASNGLTAPSGKAQQRLIRQALTNAGLMADQVDAVEAHGTGTTLGDPIEAQALIDTYGRNRPADQPLWLGSIKSNVGHTQAAAGVAGTIKMIMALRNGLLPRTLHATKPTGHVDWNAGVELLTESRPWPMLNEPRRAGISSFGVSGTNAHLIIEEAPRTADPQVTQDASTTSAMPTMWLLSGKTEAALRDQADRLHSASVEQAVDADAVARALAMGRTHFRYRAAVLGLPGDLLAGLETLATGQQSDAVIAGAASDIGKTVFVFPGQGSEWPGMAVELAVSMPVFREHIAECAAAFDPLTGWSLQDVLDNRPDAPSFDQTDVVQPALFTVMTGLARLWMSVGVLPDAVVGHSQGEIAAAYIAGALTLSDAAKIVTLRSKSLNALKGRGGMVSVAASLATVEQLQASAPGHIHIAGVNSASATVLAVDDEALIADLMNLCRERGIQARHLPASVPSHCSAVESLREAVVGGLAGIAPRSGEIAFYSTVTTTAIDTATLDADYWFTNMREPVRYHDTVLRLHADGHRTFVENTPHPSLAAATSDIFDDAGVDGVTLASLRRNSGGRAQWLTALAHAHVAGVSLDWQSILRESASERVDLPTYAFQRQRYWLNVSSTVTDASDLGLTAVDHPLLSAEIEVPESQTHVFTGKLSLHHQAWLADHQAFGTVLLPGTAFLEMVLHAGGRVGCDRVVELVLEAPLVMTTDSAITVEVVLEGVDSDGRYPVTVYSRSGAAGRTRHAVAFVAEDVAPIEGFDFAVWPPQGAQSLDIAGTYERLAERGYGYGPAFQGLRAVWRRGAEIFAEIGLPADQSTNSETFALHPALLDAALHATQWADGMDDAVNLPFTWSNVSLYTVGANALRVALRPTGRGEFALEIADGAGAPVASVGQLIVRPASAEQLEAASANQDALYEIDWESGTLAEVAEPAAAESSWAIIGQEVAAALVATIGSEQAVYRDWVTLDTALTDGAWVPEQLLLVCDSPTAVNPVEQVRTLLHETLHFVQSWLSDNRFQRSKLIVLTYGAVGIDEGRSALDLVSAPVWGLLRSAQAEHPGRIVLVDLDDRVESARLLRAVAANDEPQIAIRNGKIWMPRLGRVGKTLQRSGEGPWRLEAISKGTLDGLGLVDFPEAAEPLAPNGVRVAVHAAGVNFRDVVTTLQLVDVSIPLGNEGAGVVLEVGTEVTDFAPGDHVMGMFHQGAFGPVAVTDQRVLVRMPRGWSFEQAASVPGVYLTAYYGLVHLAGVQSGERVLIHAAAGGVGIAAAQIARHLGATVFGTASPSKWDVLRTFGIDDEHLASSRTLEFEQKFTASTSGAGFDVVLNSLAGEFVDASLRLTNRSGGRFLEMGKTDIRDASEVSDAHGGVIYRAYDLMSLPFEVIGEMLRDLAALFEAGVFRLSPISLWSVDRAPDAFRFMSMAKHVGKLVLTMKGRMSMGGTVLITGASGALAAIVARHLVIEHGVRNLLLLSRSDARAELIAELTAAGAEVIWAACDVADLAALEAVIDAVPAEHPLTGVIHLAAALHDGVFDRMTPEQLDTALRPKVDGTWNLHTVTRGLPLSDFVVFSSGAGVLGNPGQANYAAANTFQDALIAHRRSQGLPGTSLAWGLWEERGTSVTGALGAADLARYRSTGLKPLTSTNGMRLFDNARAIDKALLLPLNLDVALLRAGAGLPSPLMRRLAQAPAVRTRAAALSHNTESGLGERLSSLPREKARATLIELVATSAAAVLGYRNASEVPVSTPLRDLGFDSLTSVDLRNRLNAATGLRLPTTLVFDYPTVQAIARHLEAELVGENAEPATISTAPVIDPDDDPIVIVAMGCRYPGGANTPEDFWRLVESGGDAISEFPNDRGWDLEHLFDNLYSPEVDDTRKSFVREGGFLHEAPEFDTELFGISPREAIATDPQQRVLLETAWEVFERAGIRTDSLHGSATGVFVGCINQGYGFGQNQPLEGTEGYFATGTNTSVASGRVSYVFGLEGPAVTVDTACSSSLVALHLAVQSLRAGECSLALAGGVTVMAAPTAFVEFRRQRGLAADARCKSFADAADGTIFAEGAGLVLLERLSDARRNGHPILAVVRGSAINQDGASNGLTAPNGPSQQRLIRQALASAKLSADQVDVVEAHGTGTTLGDPIEAQAILATYGKARSAQEPLWLGTVKSNIGHTQAGAGVAGVIKMVLAMRHGLLPRTLHVDAPTSHVDWSSGGVRLLTEARPWVRGERVRRAGVSSFGISGTNAHLILEEPPLVEPVGVSGGVVSGDVLPNGVVPWVLSGRSAVGLRAQAGRLREFLDRCPEVGSADVGFSLATTRVRFEHRAVVIAQDRAGFIAGLEALAADRPNPNVVSETAASNAKVAFLFTGQGSQRLGMGRELCARYPVFAAAFDEVCAHLDAQLEQPIRDVVWAEIDSPHAALLDRTDNTQVALFAVEVALFRLVESWGVVPDFLMGHSVGEIAAAHVSGVLSLADAVSVVVARGRLMQSLPAGGAMVAVGVAEDRVLESLVGYGDRVGVAAVNGPGATVLSGDEDAVAEVAALWAGRGVRVKRLRVSHAFHSARMDAMLVEFGRVLEGVSFGVASIPIVSNVSGSVAGAELGTPEYWVRHVRACVRFADGVSALVGLGVSVFLELGPAGVLSSMGPDCVPEEHHATFVPALQSDRDEPAALATAVGRVHALGIPVDWSALFQQSSPNYVELPTYAFERQRFWLEATTEQRKEATAASDVERRFWEAVDREDLDLLSDTLDVDMEQPLRAVLPALSSWRRAQHGLAVADSWRYRATWRSLTEQGAFLPSGTWLLVVPGALTDSELVRTCVAALQAGGVMVRILGVDLAGTDRETLAGLLLDAAGSTDGVVSLLALNPDPSSAPSGSDRGLFVTVLLVQALGDVGVVAPLWCVTQSAVSVSGGDRVVNPGQAMVWGLGRVVGLEHPERWGGLIDLPLVVDAVVAGRLVRVLAGDEDQVAVRSSGVFGRRLVRAGLNRSVPAQPWLPGGTVLITGGTGVLGGYVARALAGNGAEHLLLVSRSGSSAPGCAELVRELTALGSRVTVRACDIADREALAGLLESVPAQCPLTAIIHTAGVVDDGVIESVTAERLERVLRPKQIAAMNLHELTTDLDLKAFVLFSSAAGVLGNAGQGVYAAGNAFLDALARHRRGLGLVGTSVAWGAWEGSDMGADTAAVESMVRRHGIGRMDPRVAVRALQEAVAHDDVDVVVADIDWGVFFPSFSAARRRPLLEDLPDVVDLIAVESVPVPVPGSLVHVLAEADAAERVRILTGLVADNVAVALGYSSGAQVSHNKPFQELGFDSLTAVELRNRLNAATGLRLPTSLLFDHPTVLSIAEHLENVLIPGGDSSPVDITNELDRFLSTLSESAAEDDVLRSHVRVRLERFLTEMRPASSAAAASTALDNVTAEELIEFIDRELQ
ncbi:SDR family NAD(P)-dependent oxidoreductase [Nocardia sp. NBC_01503]|nr:SDR family NAD(P)-dependent oxidoreductase [Nocardia sp. NBC_01503]